MNERQQPRPVCIVDFQIMHSYSLRGQIRSRSTQSAGKDPIRQPTGEKRGGRKELKVQVTHN